MDKQHVNALIPKAYKVLKEENNRKPLNKELKGYISTFGAAVTMGSLAAAVAFYSDNGSSNGREQISDLILKLIKEDDKSIKEKKLFEYVISNRDDFEIKENVLDAAIAIKLALNLFSRADDK